MTAQDVAAAVNFLASPTYNNVLQGTQGYRVLPIVGAEAEMSGHAATVSGFHVVSTSQFYFQLKQPDASALVNDFAGIMPLPYFALKSMPMSTWATSSYAAMPTVVSGPFMPVQGNPGIVVFDANSKFVLGPPLLTSIIFKSVGAQAVPGLFAAHELDVADELSPVAAEQLSRQSGVSVSALPGDSYEALVWDDAAPDIGSAAFRQAMMYAIHRTRLIKAVLGGYGVLANGPITPASTCYDSSLSAAYAFAPETARTTLQAANFGFGNSPWLQLPNGRTFAPVIRYVQGDANAAVVAHIIVKDLRDIAIEATAQPLTLRAFVTDETLHLNPDAAYLMKWTTSPNPSPADLWTPKAPYNLETFDWANVKNPAVLESQTLIDQQAAATSSTARQSL
ncbi:MAG: ABC transporter substrate-binding protein, partial [Firmicutes bacterium]|nr:ABC transporter substrate-binding protein [Bacillota bacterium]